MGGFPSDTCHRNSLIICAPHYEMQGFGSHCLNSDPAFFLIADPDPAQDPGF